MAEVYNEPLTAIGGRIYYTFKALEDTNTPDDCNISLQNESQRFELWAVNLGLYHLGHSSLDYRFRDAPSVFSFAYRLLRDLEKYLIIIKDTLDDELQEAKLSQRQIGAALDKSDDYSVSTNPSRLPDVPEGDCSSDEDSEDEDFDSYQAQPLVGLAIENAGHVIDRLYRLSFKVRNHATRMGFTKAQDFREIDQDTGVDLINRFADYDRNHVEEVFRYYRPKLTPDEIANHFLVQRLAKANTRRRQQFGHWRRHETKLQEGEKPASKLEDLDPVRLLPPESKPLFLETPLLGLTAPSQPSTATWLDQKRIALDDNTSVFSTSTYAIFSQETDAQLPVPQFPEKLREKKEFQCPYCHMLCSRRTAEKQAWTTHVQRDLRPYVCTYSDCKEADQQYDSFKQWVAHEAQAHRPVQHPPEHGMHDSFQAFQDDSALQNSRQCPICLESPAGSDHIGFHLWKIAVFSLPRSTGLEDESDQGSTGSVVNGRQSQDSRLTNMNDVDPLSIDGEQEDHTAAIRDDMENHEAARLTIEALKDIPDSLKSGVTVNIGNYIFGQTTGDNEETPDFDHGSRLDSSNNSDITETDEDKIMEAQESLEYYLNTLGPEHPSTLGVVATLGLRYANQQRWAEAETMMQRALQGYEKTLCPGHRRIMETIRDLGNVYFRQNKLNNVEELYQQALKGYEKTLGPEHPAILNILDNLSSVYANQHRLKEAETMMQRALQGYEKKLGPEHPVILSIFENLSSVYANQHRLEEAEKMGLRALQGYEKILGPEHRTTIRAVSNLGAICSGNGKLFEAEKMIQRALKSYDAIEDGFLYGRTTQYLGQVYFMQGKLVEAEIMYKRAAKSYDALEDSDKKNLQYGQTIEVLSNLGDLYKRQGKLVKAKKMYQRARKDLNALFGGDTQAFKGEWTIQIARNLGDINEEQGRLVEAQGMYRGARRSSGLLKSRGSDYDGGDDDSEDEDDEDDEDEDDDDEDKTGHDGVDDNNSEIKGDEEVRI